MSTHKHFDKVCCAVLALVLIVTAVFMNAERFGIQTQAAEMGYEKKLFDTSAVHTIDIEMDDWDGFLESCEDEEYETCSVIIDNEAYKNVAIRAKGNTSLSSVAAYGNDRYSFKIEFDHYDSGKNYYGLDKLSLNNIIQDNTYLKDYLVYQMMGSFGVSAPLCSFVYITVNGEDWGLYLAVEGVEESFLERNYGSDYGELYKPDSMSMGGGRGNGGNFNMEDMEDAFQKDGSDDGETGMRPDAPDNGELPENGGAPGSGSMPDFGGADDGGNTSGNEDTENGNAPGSGSMPDFGGAGGGGQMMGSDDVALIYTDDEYSSYFNIFDNAKTDPSDEDKDRLIASLKTLNEGTDIEDVVDTKQVIRYFVVHNFVCNFDSYTGSMLHNYYLYEEDGKLSMIPWDYNLAFGGFQSGADATEMVNYPIDDPVSGGSEEARPMLDWIFADEQYTELYHQYFTEFVEEYFESGVFEKMIDSVISLLSPYVEKDPTKFCTYEEFEEGTAALKEFCLLRAESVKGQAEGTIPSTSDGQKEDSSSLVDASDLSISSMGSMGNTMGGRGGQMGERPDEQGINESANEQGMRGQELSESDEQDSDSESEKEPTRETEPEAGGETEEEPAEGTEQEASGETEESEENSGEAAEQEADKASEPAFAEKQRQMPDNNFTDNNFPGRTGDAAASSDNNMLLLGISVAFLLAGLLIAFKYKR
ncbi:MAG: CotH kinase family protein [Eubacteriales bacterium]|nr:CotH kinase family protein [Eubacteriales bacterium]